MLPVTRRASIKEILNEKKSITVRELTRIFDVTDETIRRDLTMLEEQNFLVRTHGGAFIQDGVENDINISIRAAAFLDSKSNIAKVASTLISNGDTIFLDCSTTAFQIGQAIKDMRVTVVTNSLLISHLLSEYENINLIVIGGNLNRKHMCYTGVSANELMNKYFVDKTFISCRSLCLEHGITDSNESIGSIRSRAVKQAKDVYIIADLSKFDKTSFVRICDFSDVTGLIADKPLDDRWTGYLQENNIEFFFPN